MEFLSCLKKKDVINICSGMRLGFIVDVEIDVCSGKICTIIVSEKRGIFGVFCDEDVFQIPWDCIKRIGEDTILVDVDIERAQIQR